MKASVIQKKKKNETDKKWLPTHRGKEFFWSSHPFFMSPPRGVTWSITPRFFGSTMMGVTWSSLNDQVIPLSRGGDMKKLFKRGRLDCLPSNYNSKSTLALFKARNRPPSMIVVSGYMALSMRWRPRNVMSTNKLQSKLINVRLILIKALTQWLWHRKLEPIKVGCWCYWSHLK